MPDKIAGRLWVSHTDAHEVMVNHEALSYDEKGCGWIAFSPKQARDLAALLIHHAHQAETERAARQQASNQNYTPRGTRFFVPAPPEVAGPRGSGDVPMREMMLVTNDEPRAYLHGWLLYKHLDGQWVTLRKATDDDVARVSQAVVDAHHCEV